MRRRENVTNTRPAPSRWQAAKTNWARALKLAEAGQEYWEPKAELPDQELAEGQANPVYLKWRLDPSRPADPPE